MSVGYQRGFTIIEVMLFLAITGLMMVGILAGSGTAITRQRYSDTVYSLQSELQDQYSKVQNVSINCHDGSSGCLSKISCTYSGSLQVIFPATSNVSGAGQSQCVVLGRYITTNTSGTSFVERGVVGYRKTDAIADSDIADLQDYAIEAVPYPYSDTPANRTALNYLDGAVYQTTWGQQLHTTTAAVTNVPGSGGSGLVNYKILILRSPQSGRIYTLVDTGSGDGPETLLNAADTAVNNSAIFCVDGAPSTAETMGVKIDANGSGASAVEVLGGASTSGVCR